MRASIYDWMQQTPEHEEYARMEYPLAHSLVVSHNNFNDFARSVQGLHSANRLRYLAENGKWMQAFGSGWASMGCLRETSVGQRSTGRTVYGGRTRGSLAGLGGYFRTPSYPRNVISGLGAASSDRPPTPSGYTLEPTPPESQLQWTGPWETLLGYFGWNRRPAVGPKGTCYIYMAANLSDSFMALPGGKVTISVADAKALQTALNDTYLAPSNRLVVDGKIGPKTCSALHWYQYEYLGINSAKINQQTFLTLNLPLRFAQQYDGLCTSYYTGVFDGTPPSEDKVVTPGPTPEEPPIEEPPIEEPPVVKAGFNKYLLIGAVAVLGGGLLAWKLGKHKGRR